MLELVTPDDVVAAINSANDVIDDGPAIVKEAERIRDAAARALAVRKATLRLTVSGSSAERREARVVVDSLGETEALDEARQAFNYARAMVDAAKDRLSGQQTIAKLVLAAMGGRP